MNLDNMSTYQLLALTVSQKTALAFRAWQARTKYRDSTNAMVADIATEYGISAPQLRSGINLFRHQPDMVQLVLNRELTINGANKQLQAA